MRYSTILALILFCTSIHAADGTPGHSATGKNGMVVCVSAPAADVGLEILKAGGNAVDASVAVAFALAVTWPEAGNIGGGGFMMVLPGAGKEPACIDYRETAPAAATRDMFAKGKIDFTGIDTTGIPGTVRGLALAHAKYGKLKWAAVVEPAVKLAGQGFALDEKLAGDLNRILADPKTTNAEFKRVYGKPDAGKPDAGKWKAGDPLILKDLAGTLRRIAEEGPSDFYSGATAKLLVEEMKAAGGSITREDLAGYTAKERTPIHGTYRGCDIYAPPPPSSGGICLVEMLNILETFDLKKHDRYAPETCHLMIEAMKRGYCDRARFLGDPDFAKIPPHLTSKDYARKLAGDISPDKSTPAAHLAPELKLGAEGESTTHFSVIDRDGMAVSNTYTLENAFGNRIVVRGAGFLLNNEMTDFNPQPGITTTRGQIGTPANVVAPGKRMLSSMCPTIVLQDGKPILITGSPGGRTIVNTVLCVVVNAIDYDMNPREAVDAPRLHHQWLPDVARLEGLAERPQLKKKLEVMGQAATGHKQGDAHTIGIDPKTGIYRGAADTRRTGKAAGY